MSNLSSQTCSACEIGAPLISDESQISLLKDLQGWQIDHSDIDKLVKRFKFKSYAHSIKFSNLIADLAESQDHHPKIILEWGSVTLEWWSHKIKGLHMNDFICASKSDDLYQSL